MKNASIFDKSGYSNFLYSRVNISILKDFKPERLFLSMAKLKKISDFSSWIGQELKWMVRVIYSSCHRFYWDNGFSKAASLAYTTLFSLVPVTVFGFGILASVVLANETLLEQVRGFIIKQFVPSAAGADIVLEYLKTFGAQVMTLLSFEDANFGVSLFALIFLVFSCLILINSIEYALNLVWQVFEPRSIAHRLSVFCTLIVVTPVLAVSAFYTSIFIGQQMSNFVI
ncbi:MAG: hypothetical protein GYA55_06860, partial [SAR324 cluster bacterium]|nr:hypothetical protein [SAR324 cluster bacterium]